MSWLFGTAGGLFVVGIPISLALAMGSLAYMWATDQLLLIAPATMFAGLDKSATMSIPFFILAAEILSRGGAVERLISAIDALIGHFRGGLAVVAVVATMMFAAVSGSSIATAAAVGIVLIPQMKEKGYPERFSLGLIAAAGGLGILIPPSVPLIIYGTVTEESIGRLFQAGMVPGLLLGLSLCAMAVYVCAREGIPGREKATWNERLHKLWAAKTILLFPVIILGSIYGGIFTPSESSALAVVYALLITLPYFVKNGFGKLVRVIGSSSANTAAILMILAGAAVFGYAVTISGLPQQIINFVPQLNLSTWQFLLLVNLLFILLGMFLEIIAVILIALPVLFPLLSVFDIDPVHFAIIVVVNMELAVITPPIGLNLFAIASIAKKQVKDVFLGVIPFYGVIVVNLILITYIEEISLFLNRIAPPGG